MDFGTLLHVAKQNSSTTKKDSGGKFYSTKFSPPKKESKEKKLSDNIKKFLVKKEHEEREKARIEKEKRDKLLSMRDDKSKNKIKKMLKVIKSANKSVLEDAVDEDNTAVTLQGPDQPDEDDYGYVSNEAAAFYQKYVDKVKHVQEEKPFAPSRPQSRNDLSGTKDRVRAAIVKEQDEKAFPQRTRNTTSSSTSSSKASSSSAESSRRKELYDPQAEKEKELEEKRLKEEQRRQKFKKPLPPPMDFKQLLKLAEKKQFEPIEVEVDNKKKDSEKLFTTREKREHEERQRFLEERERRKREREGKPLTNKIPLKIPKLNSAESSKSGANNTAKPTPSSKPISSLSSSKDVVTKKPPPTSQPVAARPFSQARPLANMPSGSNVKKPNNPIAHNRPVDKNSNPKSTVPTPPSSKSSALPSKPKIAYNGPTREFPPRDSNKAKPSASASIQKTREFPPRDVIGHKSGGANPSRSKTTERKPAPRRILDDSDEDEYDSELDDFIDDGDAGEDYSSHIKEIFGYDKSRYRNEVYDDAGMESTFAQQMREEYMSKKIGQMEDLEDMRLEAVEKKKKAIMKKKSSR